MVAHNAEEVADYTAQARDFLDHGRSYLSSGSLHQASEKGWGAAAHMAKAVAVAQGWEYSSHSDFTEVLYRARELTGILRIRDLRSVANELHTNYYKRKRHLNAKDIDEGLHGVAELLDLLSPLTNQNPGL